MWYYGSMTDETSIVKAGPEAKIDGGAGRSVEGGRDRVVTVKHGPDGNQLWLLRCNGPDWEGRFAPLRSLPFLQRKWLFIPGGGRSP